MPSISEAIGRWKKTGKGEEADVINVFIAFGKQKSPFPDLDYIEPIIAVLATEEECAALEASYEEVKVSWETRRIHNSLGGGLSDGEVLYLAHASLEPYDVDSDGNQIYGIMQSPNPEGVFLTEEEARRNAQDYYLQKVTVGEVSILGVGEILD
ncbi:hypothetical protein AUR04nite_10420 [Glutamicibacter uratoxydans]|uniref:Uncharacterized protein n=1 Tax=Glutamicibacter uratoxydans TaxID=43667 RepID=A0A4Y4DPN6_GLUUR|nr:hypothetical protein [Glutamicibacter uratoxydans]GED05510.1 hypothetical protein AUR04nite_10420 [Glutamicibacter uratoxydans]